MCACRKTPYESINLINSPKNIKSRLKILLHKSVKKGNSFARIDFHNSTKNDNGKLINRDFVGYWMHKSSKDGGWVRNDVYGPNIEPLHIQHYRHFHCHFTNFSIHMGVI